MRTYVPTYTYNYIYTVAMWPVSCKLLICELVMLEQLFQSFKLQYV